jgi:hypothetical protein
VKQRTGKSRIFKLLSINQTREASPPVSLAIAIIVEVLALNNARAAIQGIGVVV